MQSRRNLLLYGKTVILFTALLGFLMLTGAPVSRADHNSSCQRRIAKADHRLHEAAEHHGWNSPQAIRARHNLHEAREGCYTTHHEWWDEHERRWRAEHDWDDHDHDTERHWDH